MNVTKFMKTNKALLLRIGLTFSAFLVVSIGFAALAEQVKEGDTLPFDRALLTSINHLASPTLDAFFVVYTNFGGVLFVSFLTLLLTGWLLYKKQRYSAHLIIAGVGGAAVINTILKSIFERTRPDLWTHLINESSFSFPSGHAMASSALAACVVVLLWKTKWRYVAIIGGVLYVLSIGFSRLYLGVHYPTDVIGGWLMSFTWIFVLTTMLCIRKNRSSKPQPVDTEIA